MNIHVSNLSVNLTEVDLRKMFAVFGDVSSVVILRDKQNGRSQGTAFVDMFQNSQAEQAIIQLHGSLVDGKRIQVIEIISDLSHMN